MTYIYRYINGFIQYKVKTIFFNRLLNICRNHQIEIWKVTSDKQYTYFYTFSKYKSNINKYSKKLSTSIEIEKEKGIPFVIRKYKTRVGFLLGFLLFLIMINRYTSYIWNININGSNQYSREELTKYISQSIVPLGTNIKEISYDNVIDELVNEFPNIGWISCNIQGTSLNINISENKSSTDIKKIARPCNLISDDNYIITKYIVENGTPVTAIGKEVKKGDVLISGNVSIYNEFNELIQTNEVVAEGEIYGMKTIDYNDEVAFEQYEKKYIKNTIKLYSITTHNKTINLYKHGKLNKYLNNKNSYDIYSEYKNGRIFNTFYVPIKIKQIKICKFNTIKNILSPNEAREIATKRLNSYINNLKKKGMIIVSNSVKIQIVNNKCIASGKIITNSPIGIPQYFTTFKQGDNN